MSFLVKLPLAGVFALALASAAPAEAFKDVFPQVYSEYGASAQPVFDQIEIETGKITLKGGIATVDVPAGYYFVGPSAARVVLEDLWGNPPDDTVLGMIFPRSASPLDETWGALITFDEMGYVSDEDAATTDYADILRIMQEDTRIANRELAEQGYETAELIGWAEPPHYDKEERAVYWAKDLLFSRSSAHTLNYNIRKLGRRGVLVVNFIASMEQLPEVKAAAPAIMAMVDYNAGHRYADFVPGTDAMAAVGIGGLIAGKVLSKTGLLVLLMAFLKKGGFVLLFMPIAWIYNRLRGGNRADS